VAGSVNVFDAKKRSEDILKAVETDTPAKIRRAIKFYEGCLARKDDPFLPTYRLVLQKLKGML